MTVKILFFSVLRDLAGCEEFTFTPEGEQIRLGDLIARVYERFPPLKAWEDRLLLAVNAEFADRETPVRDGDEVALMPPVQGG